MVTLEITLLNFIGVFLLGLIVFSYIIDIFTIIANMWGIIFLQFQFICNSSEILTSVLGSVFRMLISFSWLCYFLIPKPILVGVQYNFPFPITQVILSTGGNTELMFPKGTWRNKLGNSYQSFIFKLHISTFCPEFACVLYIIPL